MTPSEPWNGYVDYATLIRHSELVTTGLGPNDIRKQLGTGQLIRVRRGVYTRAKAEGVEEHLQLLQATLPAVDPGNVISHTTAALIHGLPVPRGLMNRIWMTRRTPGHGDHAKKLVVRATPLFDDEVTVVDDRAVTSIERTATDLARTLPPKWGVAIMDAALRLEVPRERLYRSLARHRKLPGIRKARMAITFGNGLAESPAESISRFHLWLAGLPAPELQVEHFDADGVFVARTDFFWPEWGVCGEVDGKWKYDQLLQPGQTAADAVMAEKRRDEGLRQLGYWPTHWDWAIANDQNALTTQILGAREQGLRRLP